jgi:3-deoxy-D-manno-octulosonate 8-phosphate phosphatase (KDO 8-P phosphatase)
MKLSKKLSSLAKNIQLIAMDVDGVLTGGEIIVLDSGKEIKIWNVKDGFGFHLAKLSSAGLKFAWITGGKSDAVRNRSKALGIDILYQECMRKKEAIIEISRKLKVPLKQTLFIGDDLLDIPVFRSVGFSVCPSDAPYEVKKEVDYISKIPGGKGVVREVVEIVLKSRGLWKKATDIYL